MEIGECRKQSPTKHGNQGHNCNIRYQTLTLKTMEYNSPEYVILPLESCTGSVIACSTDSPGNGYGDNNFGNI